MENQEVQALIERLRKYSEQEYNAHNNYIAEDLKDAADLLEQKAFERKRGHWIGGYYQENGQFFYRKPYCSVCGSEHDGVTPYCEKCNVIKLAGGGEGEPSLFLEASEVDAELDSDVNIKAMIDKREVIPLSIVNRYNDMARRKP